MRLRAGLVALSFKAVLNLAAVLSLCSTSALAANITLAPWGNDPEHAIVIVEGRLESGDEIQFRTQVGRLTKAIVNFNSDGGVLLDGIAIGKTIRLKSFSTAVLDGKRCASACALAWLGGSPRYMGRTALVGFHAAYFNKEGLPESRVGNALIGSYLTQIGLSESAVVYMTQAAPTELTLLTLPDAKQIGIEVLPFDQQTPAPKTAAPATSREAFNHEISSRARLFVKEINTRLSRINAAEWVGELYAEEVISYGKLRSRRDIVTEHRLYTEQWPERSYSIHDKSMNAVCGESGPGPAQPVPQVPVECIVTGTMEWKGRNLARNVAASGLSAFTYVLRSSGDTFIIKEVDAVPRRPTTYTTAY